ncbi:MAG: hypothetical protein WD749_08130, partial [Phycisphaerales bacterium]
PAPGGERAAPAGAGAWGGWLEPPGEWRATPAAASTLPSGSGAWVISVDLPLDSIGQGVWVNDQRLALNWMGDPRASAGGPIPWHAVDEASLSAQALRLAEPERQSPVRRWRYRLLAAGPQGLAWGMEGEPPPGLSAGERAFADPVVEAMARQDEARWAAALGWLWLADADLAERIRRRLVAVVVFEDGHAAPMWPTRLEELKSLRDDLLNPRLGGPARRERASAWLEAQAPAAAWVVDDAGPRADGGVLAEVGVANLTERATLGWAGRAGCGGGARAPDLAPVPSLAACVLTAVAAEDGEGRAAPRAGRPPARLEVHAGKWKADHAVVAHAVPVSPPGLAMSPFTGDWSMAGLLAGAPDAAMGAGPDWATAAVLSRREADSGSGWWVYLECKSPPGPDGRAPAADETVRVWLGPRGHSAAVLRVTSRGGVADERALERTGDGMLPGASVSRLADRWVAHIPVPAGAIDGEGSIRIGVERTDAAGRRTAWPRPMMPWQVEPGRIRADTGAWGAVAAEASPRER